MKQLTRSLRDDLAYILPFAAFMACLWVGSTWKSLYPASYVARVVLTTILLIVCWPHYTKIRWNHWWLGVIVGVVGIFQWVGMQVWLQNHVEFFKPPPPEDVFNPFAHFHSAAGAWSFIAVRTIGAVLVVPVMEELFWRDFLWREVMAPNDFKLAEVGEFEWPALLIATGAFASVHGNWWLSAVVWGLMVAALLVYTKSLGACIIAHATTNLLLALYVLKTHQWSFW
jgi:CAAX prenyl protease-like protein